MSKYCDQLEGQKIPNAEFLFKTSCYKTKSISRQLLNDFELFIDI